jgi:hypothetical protein
MSELQEMLDKAVKLKGVVQLTRQERDRIEILLHNYYPHEAWLVERFRGIVAEFEARRQAEQERYENRYQAQQRRVFDHLNSLPEDDLFKKICLFDMTTKDQARWDEFTQWCQAYWGDSDHE